jgi:tetratricopeptide (TPR) repeat protein
VNLLENGELEKAAEAFALLGAYQDAQNRLHETYYALGQAAADAGDQQLALSYFEKAGSYEDAEAAKEAFTVSIYKDAAEKARAAHAEGSLPAVAAALDGLNLTDLPEEYSDLAALYSEACTQTGLSLYTEGQYDNAYPYLQRVSENAEVQTALAERFVWQLAGTWEGDGHTFVLRADGSCVIDGEEMTWSYDDLATIETSTQTKYKIFSLEGDLLTLRLSGSLENWSLKRTAPSELLPLPSN